MGKFCHTDVIDAALTYIKTNCSRQIACSAQPTTFAQANTTYELADVAMGAGDFTLAAGTTSGRKITVAAKTNVAVDTAGTATHVALVDDANSKLLFVTTCPAQAVAAGGTVSFGSWSDEIQAPA